MPTLDECVAFCKEMPKLAVFAPAIGTAHGFYKGEPKIAYDLLKKITARIDIPIALHGGTGLSQEQFDKLHRGGLRQGQHLDHAQALLHRRLRQSQKREAEARRAAALHRRAV